MKCFMIERTADEESTHEWVRPDTGQKFLYQSLEPGAMYYAPWLLCGDYPHGLSVHWQGLPAEERAKGPLIVKTPGGWWCIDRPSTSGSGWQRTGTAPNITVAPSIFHDPPNGWHGWLHNGDLTPV
jgi:hypothetical protein